MRYTHKLDKPEGNCNYFLIPDQEQCDAAENKLGQLEDIEEELGIDLIIFMRILRQMDAQDFKPVEKLDKDWIATPYQNVRYFIDLKEQKLIEHGREEHVLNFKDYGKKWALTKKELK